MNEWMDGWMDGWMGGRVEGGREGAKTILRIAYSKQKLMQTSPE